MTLRPILAAALAAFVAAPKHAAHSHSSLHFFFHLGVAGLFLISIIDSSFVPLPIPGVTDILLVLYAAAHTNVVLLVALATAGSALGGFLSHAVGQAGGMAFLEKHVPPRVLARVTHWMETHAILAVALPAILPPPMPLSAFVLVAGAVRMSRKKFMTAFTISRFVRHCIAVWLGVHYGKSVLHIWNRFSEKWATPVLIAFWAIILVCTTYGIWKLYKTSRSVKLRPSALTRDPGSATP